MLSEYITSLANVSFSYCGLHVRAVSVFGKKPDAVCGFLAYFCAVLRFSDPPYAPLFIDRFHRIDPTKTYNFFAPILVTSASHKITAKCYVLCPKTLLLKEKQLHAIQSFEATCNVCPLAIPQSCAHN